MTDNKCKTCGMETSCGNKYTCDFWGERKIKPFRQQLREEDKRQAHLRRLATERMEVKDWQIERDYVRRNKKDSKRLMYWEIAGHILTACILLAFVCGWIIE